MSIVRKSNCVPLPIVGLTFTYLSGKTSFNNERKVNIFIYFIQHYAMKIYGGKEVEIHEFMTYLLDGVHLSNS